MMGWLDPFFSARTKPNGPCALLLCVHRPAMYVGGGPLHDARQQRSLATNCLKKFQKFEKSHMRREAVRWVSNRH